MDYDWSLLTKVAGLALLAGGAMPVGGLLASVEKIRPRWLEDEFRHSVIAFGGGALLSAVALVLVPEGAEKLSVLIALAAFVCGGGTFMGLDIFLAKHKSPASQLVAMLSDFLPEAMAMGAIFGAGRSEGPLLAMLIAIQNLPEGFNAYRELKESSDLSKQFILLAFAGLALLGPVCAAVGLYVLVDRPETLAVIMIFAAGGILYLTFGDIAPQAKLKRHWGPPMGAVAGFALGLLGHMLVK